MEILELKKVNTGLFKIELNSRGEYVEVSIYNTVFFDRFAAGVRYILSLSEKIQKKLRRIERKYKNRQDADGLAEAVRKKIGIKTDFSNEAIKVIDGIFGEGTIKKYFHDLYERDLDFLPDEECFADFFEQITPVMKMLSDMRAEAYPRKQGIDGESV